MGETRARLPRCERMDSSKRTPYSRPRWGVQRGGLLQVAHVIDTILVCLLLLSALYWLLAAVRLIQASRGLPALAGQAPLERWPRVSVVVPACNEAETVEAAARSRLTQDYPALELILIDDRSTDSTPTRVDAVAASDARVRPVHLTELPAGWLGKVNALRGGTAMATGEWLLFTDADVHLEADALRAAVAYAERQGLDMLTVWPRFWPGGFWVDAVFSASIRIFTAGARLHKVRDPESPIAVGVGAFNLVRRAAFDRTSGWEWLRMEVVDDLGLGQMIKRAGGRCGIAEGGGRVALQFYGSLGEMARGLEKNAFAFVGGYRFRRLLLAMGLLLAVEWMPFSGLMVLPGPWRWVAGGLVIWALALNGLCARFFRRPLLSALAFPLGTTVLAALMTRAGWLAWRRGGIDWRGTHYSIAALRAGSRVKPPPLF